MDNLIIGSIIKIRNQGQGEMDYWFDEEKTLNRTFSKFLNTPRFTSGELPVSYRVLNHWGNLGILPEGINNNGSWRKFTFVERVWIGVASHLRDFGFPLEKIAEVRKHILKYNKKIKAYYHFEYYIVRALASSDDTYVIVLNDGTADVGNQEEIEINKAVDKSMDMLLISIKSVLQSLGHKVVKPDFLVGLNEQEKNILEKIRISDSDDITIKLKDNKITETQSTKIYNGKTNLDNIYKEIKENKDFADVLIKYQNGVGEMVKVVKKNRSKE